jgi:hypothetical protein
MPRPAATESRQTRSARAQLPFRRPAPPGQHAAGWGIVGRAECHQAHEALHLGDVDAKMADRLRIMQEATFDAVKVARRRPELNRLSQLGRMSQQQRQLLLCAQHQAADGVEEKARVLNSLLAPLVLGHVERDAKQAAQLDEPRIVGLSIRESLTAEGAAVIQPEPPARPEQASCQATNR